MSDKVHLIAQIRFALEQLSERNAQHEWEHLSRHLARERICANILPATGPVQAGGDQGRDFETFQTYLQASTLKSRSFVGLISERPLAFACTLEKSIAPKIRRDVATIMSSGTPVAGINIFCSRGLAVAKRHELQEWCRTSYGISLEVFDGAAVAEMLCARDLYWLAERYLQMPSELLPPVDKEEAKSWYTHTLEKWRQNPNPPRTFADFVEIKAASEHARGEFQYKEDGTPINRHEHPELPFWISKLDELAKQETLPALSRRAVYQASVLRLRGLGSLHGQEDRLRSFFNGIKQLKDTAEIQDVEVLLTYLLAAERKGEVGLSSADLAKWAQELSGHLDDRIRQAKKDDRKNEWCALLEIRAHIAMFSRFDEGKLCTTEAFQYWVKLAKLAANAPLFPLERFADRLVKYAVYVGTHPEYDALTEAVDALVVQRFGQFKAAEKCLERAKAFFESGDLSRAMTQLHRAKIDWFAEETLQKAIMAMRMLSQAYSEQGLYFAAKYYTIAASYLVFQSSDLHLKPFMARSLAEAASCDYALGAWHGFLELADVGAMLYPHFATDPDADFNNDGGVLQTSAYYLSLVPLITKCIHPELEMFARERCTGILERLGLADGFAEIEEDIVRVWGERSDDEILAAIQEQLAGWPWSDAGNRREAQWSAHGVMWRVSWQNDYETTLVTEEFLAGLQVFLSDLAGYDLCLLRSTLNITLEVATQPVQNRRSNQTGFDTYFQPANEERYATVMLPPYEQFHDGTLTQREILAGTLGVIASLLAEVSLLPTKRFNEVLGERFSKGLPHKLFIAAPYGQCLRTFVSEKDFSLSSRHAHQNPATREVFPLQPSEKLPWYDGPCPGYSETKAHQQIKNRYEKFTRPIRITLKRLAENAEFQATVAHLREGGWKDWHILAMVYNVTVNYRMGQPALRDPQTRADMKALEQMLQQPETADSPMVPLEQYREENLRQSLPFYMASYVKTSGLELNQETLNVPGIEAFLAVRCHFWADDIEHEDYFQSQD